MGLARREAFWVTSGSCVRSSAWPWFTGREVARDKGCFGGKQLALEGLVSSKEAKAELDPNRSV